MGFLQRNWHIFLALAGVAIVVPAAIGVAHYLQSSSALTSPETAMSTTVSNTLVTPTDVNASIAPSEGALNQKLSTCGRWLTNSHYGRVWAPAGVSDGWQPYTVGHWSYSQDDGWYWNSDEQWSDTYHYGRWYDDSEQGWIWVPGTEWAPSWVAWRETDTDAPDGGYYGWAPLPPEGYAGYEGPAVFDQPGIWAFVAARYLTSSHIHRVMIPHDRNAAIIGGTRVINNVRMVDNHGVNRGVDPQRAAQLGRRPVPAFNGQRPAALPGGAFGHGTDHGAAQGHGPVDVPGHAQDARQPHPTGPVHRPQPEAGLGHNGPGNAPHPQATHGEAHNDARPAQAAPAEGNSPREHAQPRNPAAAMHEQAAHNPAQPHEQGQPTHQGQTPPEHAQPQRPQPMPQQHAQPMMPQGGPGPQNHGGQPRGNPGGNHGGEHGDGGHPQGGPQGGGRPAEGPQPGGGDHGGGGDSGGGGGGGDHHGH